MFGLKILLKLAQKVDVSYEFLKAYIFNLEETNYGKEFMIICLDVACELALSGKSNEIEIKLNEYKDDKHMSYLLKEVKKYLDLSQGKFMLNNSDSEISDRIRNTRSNSCTDISTSVLLVKSAVKAYINNLWEQVMIRLDYTDTNFCTSFSEAPAESVFSIYECCSQ